MRVLPLRRPNPDGPLRLRPKDGPARCAVEQFSHWICRNWLLLYVAVIATLVLVFQTFAVHIVPSDIPKIGP